MPCMNIAEVSDNSHANKDGVSGFLKEPTLLAFAYDLEQAIKPRTQPQFLGSVPPEPPDAGICATLTAAVAPQLVNGKAQISRHLGTGRPFSP